MYIPKVGLPRGAGIKVKQGDRSWQVTVETPLGDFEYTWQDQSTRKESAQRTFIQASYTGTFRINDTLVELLPERVGAAGGQTSGSYLSKQLLVSRNRYQWQVQGSLFTQIGAREDPNSDITITGALDLFGLRTAALDLAWPLKPHVF